MKPETSFYKRSKTDKPLAKLIKQKAHRLSISGMKEGISLQILQT